MNNMIKTISLDDIGAPQAGDSTQAKNRASVFNPNYVPSFGKDMGPREDTVSRAFEETNGSGAEVSGVTRFTALIGPRFKDQGLWRKVAIVVATLLALGAAVYFYLDSEGLLSDFALSEIETVNTPEVDLTKDRSPELPKTPTPIPEATAVPPAPPPPPAETIENPYWALPNPLLSTASGAGEASASAIEGWRYGLTHPYTYQRYKTVQAMRNNKGAEDLLRDAISQPKFWTRMEAVLGLAELGETVSPETMQAVFAGVRRDLPRNYFRRFRSKESAASTYVMRQAVRVVDARVREIIIQNLALSRGPDNDIYLYAATFDSHPEIKRFAEEQILRKPLAAGVQEAFDRASTNAPPPAPAAEAASGEAPANVAVPRDLEVEKVPLQTNVEEVYFLNDEGTTESIEAKEAPMPTSNEDDGFDSLD